VTGMERQAVWLVAPERVEPREDSHGRRNPAALRARNA
jgi:hypothetical protein